MAVAIDFHSTGTRPAVVPRANRVDRVLRLTSEDAYESGSGQQMAGIVPGHATEQDSSKLMELVAEIIKELDERDRKLKSAVVNKDCDESSFGMSLAPVG